MSGFFFEKGREAFADKKIDWNTDTIKDVLLDLNDVDVGMKGITGASNATPIVITSTSHGFANGDLVYIDAVGGNLAANGYWKIANVAANTFELTDPVLGSNAVGSAAYTSGGYAICLGPSAAGDMLDDFSAGRVGTDQTLTTPTLASGVLDADDVTHALLSGDQIEAVAIYHSTGTESTSEMLLFLPGKQIVTCAMLASAGATTMRVDPLVGAIPSATTLTFSDGKQAVTNGTHSAGARQLTVNALAANILEGARALSIITSSGFPYTPNGADLVIQWSNGPNKIAKL